MSVRPVDRTGYPKLLTADDPLEWWEDEAKERGMTVEAIRAQIELADKVIAELRFCGASHATLNRKK